jgi:hypothetical protein
MARVLNEGVDWRERISTHFPDSEVDRPRD